MASDPVFPPFSLHDVSWIGSLGPLGALGGALLAILPIRFIGLRATVTYLGFPPSLSSWILILLATSVREIFIARFLGKSPNETSLVSISDLDCYLVIYCLSAGGIGVGVITVCAPLYVMGIAAPQQRGRLGVLPQVSCSTPPNWVPTNSCHD
jgi:MFS family permease